MKPVPEWSTAPRKNLTAVALVDGEISPVRRGLVPKTPLGFRLAYWRGITWTLAGTLARALGRDMAELGHAGLTAWSSVALVRCNAAGPMGPQEVRWDAGWWIACAPYKRGWWRLPDAWCLPDEEAAEGVLLEVTGNVNKWRKWAVGYQAAGQAAHKLRRLKRADRSSTSSRGTPGSGP